MNELEMDKNRKKETKKGKKDDKERNIGVFWRKNGEIIENINENMIKVRKEKRWKRKKTRNNEREINMQREWKKNS